MGRLDKSITGLRNRSRITNKTRIKIIDGDLDEADLIILEEDPEKSKVLDTAGVEHEDAREEHLVQVLAAANLRASGNATSSTTKGDIAPAVHIPIPDATGVVDDYSSQYPPGRWRDPINYIKFSDPVEECVSNGISGGFTYYMDDQDSEWLEKYNKAESSTTGATTRSSSTPARSAKARGKEPDQPRIPISEDQFEFVMGLFEKLTEENHPFIHLDVISSIPPISEYEQWFSNPLIPAWFPDFCVPSNTPDPSSLVKLAKAIYPHWKERKIARKGQRIIPQLNYDESNDGDPFVCFRRRDVKPVRKTRRTDTASVDRMLKLKAELGQAKDLAERVLSREVKKLEVTKEARVVIDSRLKFLELKRKFPTLSNPADDELLIDRTIKRPKLEMTSVGSIKLTRRSRDMDILSPFLAMQTQELVNPIEKAASIQAQIDAEVSKKKERDSDWEDGLDLPYMSLNPNAPQRLFRLLSNIEPSRSTPRDGRPLTLRLRLGRGGRYHCDRRSLTRLHPWQQSLKTEEDISSPRQYQFTWPPKDESEDDRLELEVLDLNRQLVSKWRFDVDASERDEESTRVVDDYAHHFIRSRLSRLSEADHNSLSVSTEHIKRCEAEIDARQEKAREKGLRALAAQRQLMHVQNQAQQQAALRREAAMSGNSSASQSARPSNAPTPSVPSQSPQATMAAPPQPPQLPNAAPPPNQQNALHAQQMQAQTQAALLQNTALKKVQQSATLRHPSNNVRPPHPLATSQTATGIALSQSQQQPLNGAANANGLKQGASTVSRSFPQGNQTNGSVANGHDPNANGRALDSSMQAKAQQHGSQMALPQVNGFQSPSFNGYPIAQNGNSSYIPMPHHLPQQNGHAQHGQQLTEEQLATLKSALAAQNGIRAPPNMNGMARPQQPQSQTSPFAMPQAVNGMNPLNLPFGPTNMPLKLPAGRQMQWTNNQQRPNANGNGVDNAVAGMNGTNGTPLQSKRHLVESNGNRMSPVNGHRTLSGSGNPSQNPNGRAPTPMHPHMHSQMAAPNSQGRSLPHIPSPSSRHPTNASPSPRMPSQSQAPGQLLHSSPHPAFPPLPSPASQHQLLQEVQASGPH